MHIAPTQEPKNIQPLVHRSYQTQPISCFAKSTVSLGAVMSAFRALTEEHIRLMGMQASAKQ